MIVLTREENVCNGKIDVSTKVDGSNSNLVFTEDLCQIGESDGIEYVISAVAHSKQGLVNGTAAFEHGRCAKTRVLAREVEMTSGETVAFRCVAVSWFLCLK